MVGRFEDDFARYCGTRYAVAVTNGTQALESALKAAGTAVTARTKAIIPVHNGGYPADMDRLNALAEEHGLTVIEVCAHAHGSEWKGSRAGLLGHLGCFSFQQANDAELPGVPRSTFIRALNAEGIPVTPGAHGGPIYNHPVLRDNSDVIAADCPQAERIGKSEALCLLHQYFLGERREIDLILAAMEKVSRLAPSLREAV